MDFDKLVQRRQSVRGYTPQLVEKEKIEACLEAARLAPSACNAQPWHFVVVTDAALKNAIADATASRTLNMNHFTKQAPVHIVMVRESKNFNSSVGSVLKEKNYAMYDIGIAAAHLCLQAADLGLGTCILGWFNEKKVRELIGVPRGKRIDLIITLGYPTTNEVRPKVRKTTEEIVSYNSYK
ncbi:MAG: nitroreductase family protein [Prevotellaceae bacterium]|jgi:nitroreductase|nr:nitroreductase family protein [Prevotellaceae bacterium]